MQWAREMALPRTSPSVLLLYSIVSLFILPISYACPLLNRRLCEATNATVSSLRRCGEHVILCSGSEAQIQLYGKGQWCNITEFSYADRELVVQDLGLNLLLTHHACGHVYSFAPPAPPLPRPISFKNSLRSGFNVFNCEVDTYNFSRDVFTGAYKSSGCSGFDLYYAYEYEGQLKGAPSNCTGGGNFFEWRLRFDESGRNLSVLSAGFSHQRKLRPECFSCRMSRTDCSPVPVGNATACSCSKTCSDANSKMTMGKMWIIIGAMILGFLSTGIFLVYYCFHKKIYHLFKKWNSKNI